jgi:DnaJ-domain-containing protein 1
MARPFMSGYKTYEGERGNRQSWSQAFQGRMGFAEAEEIIHGQDETPRGILGVGPKATWEDVRKAYRAKSMACHPDLCSQHGLTPEAATAAFKKLTAAYTVLEREFGK